MKQTLLRMLCCITLTFLLPTAHFGQTPEDISALKTKLNGYSQMGISKRQAIKTYFTEAEKQLFYQYQEANRSTPATSLHSRSGNLIYALDIYLQYGDFGYMSTTGPYDITSVSTQEYDIYADDFDASGTLYLADAYWNWLYSMDYTTGTLTEIGPFWDILSDHWISGLSYDFNTNTWYAISIDGDGHTQLYSLDVTTQELTAIGNGTGNPSGIWLEIDNNGIAYMADIVTDSLYTVNLDTGVATMVGPLDIDLEWAQDVTIDPADNTMYISGNLLEESFVYTVNLSTGHATLLGTSNLAEYGGFSMPGNPLGVAQQTQESIALYPNPTTGNVVLSTPQGMDIQEVRLYDSTGKNMDIHTDFPTIDLSAMAPGIYLMQVVTENGTITKKIVKQ